MTSIFKQFGDYTSYPYLERAYPGVDRDIVQMLLLDVSNIPPVYDVETDPEFAQGWEEGALS